jgi:ribosomal protein L7Ae-like RNA K-turn-binding protein
MNKTLNLLGLATRARMIVLGQEFVMKELARTTNAVVFLASDSGDNIKKKLNDKTKVYNFTLITEYNSDELSKAIGKENRRLILIKDRGFCKKFREYLDS